MTKSIGERVEEFITQNEVDERGGKYWFPAQDRDIERMVTKLLQSQRQEIIDERDAQFLQIIQQWIDKGFELDTLKDKVATLKIDDLLNERS